MSQGLSKGEKPAWNTTAKRSGAGAMEQVKAQARRRPIPKKPGSSGNPKGQGTGKP